MLITLSETTACHFNMPKFRLEFRPLVCAINLLYRYLENEVSIDRGLIRLIKIVVLTPPRSITHTFGSIVKMSDRRKSPF